MGGLLFVLCDFVGFGFEGCCGMVLDHEKYANVTQPAGQSGYRKRLNLMTGEISRLNHVLRAVRITAWETYQLHSFLHEPLIMFNAKVEAK